MIVEIIFYMITGIIDKLTGFVGMGQVPLRLPWGIDDWFVQGVSGFKVLAQAFPPFNTILGAFVIYLLFRICLRLLRAVPILGRTISA